MTWSFLPNGSISSSTIDKVAQDLYSIFYLKANYNKSKIFWCRLLANKVNVLTINYGFKVGALPVRYLGVPLITGKLFEKELKPFTANIIDRLIAYTTNHLSFASRLQLISSIIEGITNFWSFIFIILEKLLKRLNNVVMPSSTIIQLWLPGLFVSQNRKGDWVWRDLKARILLV